MFFLILAFDEYFKQKEATFAETKPRKRTYSLYLKDFHEMKTCHTQRVVSSCFSKMLLLNDLHWNL